MASENKKKKLKNSYCVGGYLKCKEMGPKRTGFFTPAMRKASKNALRNEVEEQNGIKE